MSNILLSYIEKVNNNTANTKDDREIAENIEELSENDLFYQIPLKFISKIIFFSKNIPVETAKIIINKCYGVFGDKSITLLNSLSFPDVNLNELMSIIVNFSSSPLCKQLKVKYFDQTEVDVDWQYEIDQLKEKIRSLQTELDKYKPKKDPQIKNKVNTKPRIKATNIFDACKFSDIAYLTDYVKKGKSLNVKDSNGETPLLILAQRGDLSMIKYVVEHGSLLEEKSSFGYTAFARACEYGYYDVAQYLYSKGADINTRNGDGFTPIFYAARDNNIKILNFLLQNKANKYIKNNSGKQAIDYAKEESARNLLL